MTKKHSTKKALMASVLSLLLCFSMLIGTTFAWFTDSVTSANNIIKSGNLDVELYYQAEGQTDWTKVTNTTNVFKENALWEPGHTEVVKLKVVNEGSLALKYNLGVNVASEVGSVNVNDVEFKLSDFIKFGIVDGAQSYTRDQAIAAAEANGATALKTAYNSGTTALEAKNDGNTDEKIVTMVVYMPTTVGNEANFKKGATVPTIHLGINLMATQITAESDSFDNQYDANAMTYVKDTAEAQAALDAAVPGTVIKLLSGASYGTLYLRPVSGSTATKTVDWIGNNYGFESYSLFEDLTIVGADGATIDAIVIEGGTYYHTAHSQADVYPVMLSLVELKNVAIDGVTFTGKGGYDPQGYGNAINLSGNNIKVDGLTLKNCVLDNADNNARLIYKTESTTAVHNYTYNGESFTFSPSLKDITVTGCAFNGGYIGLELRETENVTITNNIFNVADRNILLPVNSGCAYSGTVTITNNVSNNAKERFVRMSGAGDATVVIKDNVVNNYFGEDVDYIKVTDGNNVTVENNTIVYGWNGVIPTAKPDSLVVDTATKLISINDAYAFAYLNTLLNDGNFTANYGAKWQYTVELNCDINLLGNEWTPIVMSNFVGFDGKGHTISNLRVTSGADKVGLFGSLGGNDLSSYYVKNLTIDGAYVKGGNYAGALVGSGNCVVENVTVLNATVEAGKYIGGLAGRTCRVINCTIKNSTVVASDKTVGGLVGYCINDPGIGSAINNTVENVTVTGAWNVGGMFGQAQNVNIDGNTVKNCFVASVKPLPDDASSNEVRVAELAARSAFAGTTIGTNTIENVVVAEIVYIYNLNDFAEFGKAVNNNTKYNGSIVANNPKTWVEVMSDIDMTNAPGIQGGQFSIGNGNNNQFQGVFDGNGHTISNYTIIGSWTYNVSLFRTVSGNFTMKDITFDNCSATKPNNREASLLVGTIGGGTITFDNVDIKNSTVSGVAGAAAYAGKMTEGALYFIDCDVDNVTLNASSASGSNAMFLDAGYSHHDYETSGVWVENCTISNSHSFVNGVEDATVSEYNYTK